jgi:hypothetical protein
MVAEQDMEPERFNIVSINDPLVQFRKEQTTMTAANDNKASKIGTGKKSSALIERQVRRKEQK